MSVHVFSIDNVRIAVDGNSGAVHVLDDLSYKLLQTIIETGDWTIDVFDGYTQDEVNEALSELLTLKSNGLLFSPPLSGDRLPNCSPHNAKALCLNVSHDCNLRCVYCFAGKGTFGGERLNMPPEVGRKAVDFLLESATSPSVEIDFFGGEPLLNMAVVRDVVEYGRHKAQQYGKEISFTITTNGLGLDEETSAYLNDNMYNIVLSLDGRPEVTDRMRRLPVEGAGRSTHGIIMPKVLGMAKMRDSRLYYVRGTYTAYNLDFAEDVRYLVESGFRSVSVEPVVALQEDYALREEHLPKLFAEYERLAHYYLDRAHQGKPFDFFHFTVELDNPPCLQKRLTGCGAGHEYLAVDPYGDIYPCHQFVGKREYRMGSVISGWDEESRERLAWTFASAHVENKPTCRDCWAKFYCGGGCHANALLRTGDLLLPDPVACELQKKRLECALYIKAVLMAEQ